MGVLDIFLKMMSLTMNLRRRSLRRDSSREKSHRLMIWMKRKKSLSRRKADVQVTARLHQCVSRQEGMLQQWKFV